MRFKTTWTHKPVNINQHQRDILDSEINDISDELDDASDLIFHTVFLSENKNGPLIIVEGKDGVADTVYLTYYETPEWVY